MAKNETGEKLGKKLVKNDQAGKPNLDPAELASGILTNRKKRRARLHEHKVKDGFYYGYRLPGQKEIYLGTADFILEAVMEKRRPKK